MKISGLVAQLLKVQQDEGDIEIRFASDVPPGDDVEGDCVDIAGVATILGDDDQPLYAMVCDEYTLDSIS